MKPRTLSTYTGQNLPFIQWLFIFWYVFVTHLQAKEMLLMLQDFFVLFYLGGDCRWCPACLTRQGRDTAAALLHAGIVRHQSWPHCDCIAWVQLFCGSCWISVYGFFSFGIHYPVELKIFYGFLEHLMGLEPSVKSVVLADFIRSVSRIDAYSSAMQCEDGWELNYWFAVTE